MDSLKEFLDTKYTDYDLVENEEGTFIILSDNTKYLFILKEIKHH